VLAWVPFVLALLVYDRYRAGTRLERLVPVVALWLLFMPNAPYILTDFIHLRQAPHTPLWFDAAVLSHQLGQHLAKELKGYLPKKAA
jgi:uncharacterized membrane protein